LNATCTRTAEQAQTGLKALSLWKINKMQRSLTSLFVTTVGFEPTPFRTST